MCCADIILCRLYIYIFQYTIESYFSLRHILLMRVFHLPLSLLWKFFTWCTCHKNTTISTATTTMRLYVKHKSREYELNVLLKSPSSIFLAQVKTSRKMWRKKNKTKNNLVLERKIGVGWTIFTHSMADIVTCRGVHTLTFLGQANFLYKLLCWLSQVEKSHCWNFELCEDFCAGYNQPGKIVFFFLNKYLLYAKIIVQ